MGTAVEKHPAYLSALRPVGVAVGVDTKAVFVVSPGIAMTGASRIEAAARATAKPLDSILAVYVRMEMNMLSALAKFVLKSTNKDGRSV